ncbi:porin [Roseateles asaccharophilus]|uniref:Porin n=1 Tax=Roseateles asaccharophilus TaxID=582607 RepID=A0ABU2A1I2_9BURK|nr:porin [Roseateles asaccharophilus]MDR7331049.1 putative porin [Roseateles asaccharophilus]
MKKALIALAVLGLTGGAAMAQSSVTLFGIVDANLRYTKASGQTLKQLGTDGLNSSRLGVRGTEDLGGGLKAGFWLEAALNPDTGTADATRFWGRRASVSLLGDFGEVRLGRGKTSTRLHIDDFDPYSTTGLGDVSKVYSVLGSGSDTLNRSDNMVQYFLPTNLGGFYGSVDVAAGEGASGKKMMGGRAGYKQGPLNAAVAYETTTGLANDKYKQFSVGAAYDFGVVRPSFNYSENKFRAAKQTIYTIAATAPLGQGQILASYTDSKANTAAEAISGVGDAKLLAVGYVYNVSKRTALYTTAAQIKNNKLGRFAVAGSPTVVNGAKSSGFDVGVRHSF